MEQDPGQERVTEAVPESDEMSRVPRCRRGAGLDLDTDDLTTFELAEQVDLETALPWRAWYRRAAPGHSEFGAQL